MNRKMTLLTLAAACAAMLVLPPVALAGNWQVHPGKVDFVISASTETFTAETVPGGSQLTVHCTGTAGSGSYTHATTGTMWLILTGCKSSGLSCTSPGWESGTVSINGNFTNVYLSEGKATPGLTITTFAEFSCFLVKTTVTGSINGHLEKGCNGEKTESTSELEFKSTETHGAPSWTYVTANSELTPDRLTFVTGGTERRASLDATWKLHFNEPAGPTCV